MRDPVPGVTLPWWDWTLRLRRAIGIPQIFADRTAGDGPNPLAAFPINLPNTNPPLTRNTGRDPGSPGELPSQDDVDDVLGRTDWDDFADALEDVHDRVHGWVPGDMGNIGSAAFDPIVWSYHAMIDRLWWLWPTQNGNSNINATAGRGAAAVQFPRARRAQHQRPRLRLRRSADRDSCGRHRLMARAPREPARAKSAPHGRPGGLGVPAAVPAPPRSSPPLQWASISPRPSTAAAAPTRRSSHLPRQGVLGWAHLLQQPQGR
jgi:hypothetical protein